jgi:hypothetical protein
MAKPTPLNLDNINSSVVRCPKCGEQEAIDTKSLQYELHRRCRTCGNEWSGGLNVAKPDPFSTPPVPGVGVPDADEDLPDYQYTGADFRDPNKNFGG